ncbi:FKBP-type peptidyl-prolyl cis-trans isomerase [Candidatus Nitrosacidococcus tergens]|uniref:Peptidyl-prolyl cis-trans isomerase n=1 Tax=Candidatus Nitrosacidococcus tergens TaxID=553981 RepID=A0A7G1Q8H8_9GAMM|nr:FKBP-type peptidyl-prolyl cis-trans isomerase [Candidatus Nitrosacidococcus tergens]CAB1275086.1 Outer membrane protein MIP [Candidatus Nitrosacidococcus tergens]
MKIPKQILLFLFLILSLGLETPSFAGDLDTDNQKMSYIIGYQLGHSMEQQGITIDKKALTLAIDDAMQKIPAKVSPEEAQKVMTTLQKKEEEQKAQQAKTNKERGEVFLKENKTKPGVVTLPSGLQYKILQEGKGKIPTAKDKVEVNYRGTLIDGTEFDSSYSRNKPVTFKIDQVIKGWQEALSHMPVGSKWQIYVPADLAYGPQGAGHFIGPDETLIFDIELLGIK